MHTFCEGSNLEKVTARKGILKYFWKSHGFSSFILIKPSPMVIALPDHFWLALQVF